MGTFIITAAVLALLTLLGAREKKQNDRNLEHLDIRINVNGIRGKSTATRLITAVLWEAGYKAVGKTTGTAARMMYWDRDGEEEVKRYPRGVNISEQIDVIREAAACGADALVCECMAVRPEYQKVYQEQMIKAQVTVIVNVLEDHLEEMGPTTAQIAQAFANTIPYHGTAVVPKCEFTPLFMETAWKRGSTVQVIDDTEITGEYLAKFDYRLFSHNCAAALAVARALGISDEVAFRGMLKAHPDPGALRFYHLQAQGQPFVLVNAYAANEPASTLSIWETAREENPGPAQKPLIIMNCRPDRMDRTRQFVRDFIPRIPDAALVSVGDVTKDVTEAYRKGAFKNVTEYHDLDGVAADVSIREIAPLLGGRMVLLVGNIHGIGGQPLLDEIIRYGTPGGEWKVLPGAKEAKKEPKEKKEGKETAWA